MERASINQRVPHVPTAVAPRPARWTVVDPVVIEASPDVNVVVRVPAAAGVVNRAPHVVGKTPILGQVDTRAILAATVGAEGAHP